MQQFKKISLLCFLLFASSTSIATEYKHKAPVHGLLPPGNPYFSVTPFNIQFPSTPVGSSSTAAVTVTNPDTFESLVNVRAALDSNVFSFESNTCGTSAAPSIIGASQSCSAVIKFTPVSVGSFTGTFAISADNSRNGTQSRLFTAEATGSINLQESGQGVTSASTIQGNAKAFPFTFVNTGNIPTFATFASLTGADFSIGANTCGSEASPVALQAGQSCSITAVGSSLDVTSIQGTLNLYSNQLSTPSISRELTLSVQAPVVSLANNPINFNFGDVSNGNSVSRFVSITNTGNVSVSNLSISYPAETGLSLTSNTCGTAGAPVSLQPSTSCTITFSYGGTGFNNSLSGKSVTVSGTGVSISVPLIGTLGGFNANAVWSYTPNYFGGPKALSAADLTFGNTPINSTSSAKPYVLYNTGSKGAMNVGFSVSGDVNDFTVNYVKKTGFRGVASQILENDCGASQPYSPATTGCLTTDISTGIDAASVDPSYPRPFAVISISFSPKSLGAKSLTITPTTSNGTGLPAPITITGTGDLNSIATVTSGSPVNFGSVINGATAPTAVVNITNTGYSAFTLSNSITGLPSSVSVVSNTCSAVEPNASCAITLSMSTANVTSFSNVSATTSGATTNATISLSGTVVAATSYASISNGAVNFGTISYDAGNANFVDRTVNVTNTGNSPLTVNTVSGLPAGVVFQSTTCSNVAVNGTCSLVFRLKSDGTTSFTNTAITLNGPTGQDSITLTGSVTALNSVATVSSGSPINFGTVNQGATNPTASVSITNTGNAAMTLSGASGLPAGVSVTANTCSNIAVNATCSLTFTLSTASATAFSGSAVQTSGAGSNGTVYMTGAVVSSSGTEVLNVKFNSGYTGQIDSAQGLSFVHTGTKAATNPAAFSSIASMSNFGNALYSNPTKSGATANCSYTVDNVIEASDRNTALDSLATQSKFTIEMWVKPDSASMTGIKALLSNYEVCSGTRGWVVALNAGKPYINLPNGSADVVLTSPSAITAGQWTHLAVTKSANIVYLYVNGALVADATTFGTTTATTNAATKLRIANYHTIDSPFIGAIDDIRIISGGAVSTGATYPVPASSYASTASNAAVLVSGPATIYAPSGSTTTNVYSVTNTSSLVSVNSLQVSMAAGSSSTLTIQSTTCGSTLAPSASCSVTVAFSPSVQGVVSGSIQVSGFNSNTSAYAISATGNAPDASSGSVVTKLDFESSLSNSGTFGGSWTGPVTFGVAGSQSGAYGIFSASANASRAYDANIAQFTGDFTIEAWIKPTAVSSAYRAIYMSGAVSNGQPNFGMYFSGNNEVAWIVGTYGQNVYVLRGNNTVPVNTWAHIAVSRQGSTLRMFVNGVLQTNSVYLQNGNPSGMGAGTVTGSGSVWIGRSYSAGEEFTGNIDMLRVTKGVARYTTSFTPSNY